MYFWLPANYPLEHLIILTKPFISDASLGQIDSRAGDIKPNAKLKNTDTPRTKNGRSIVTASMIISSKRTVSSGLVANWPFSCYLPRYRSWDLSQCIMPYHTNIVHGGCAHSWLILLPPVVERQEVSPCSWEVVHDSAKMKNVTHMTGQHPHWWLVESPCFKQHLGSKDLPSKHWDQLDGR